MKKLLALLLLASPCLATGQRYGPTYDSPRTNLEFQNAYQQIRSPDIGTGTASTMTITYLNVSTINVTGTVSGIKGLILQSLDSGALISSTATVTSVFARSGIQFTFTPKASNSKMNLRFTGNLRDSNTSADVCFVTLEKNGTNLAANDHFVDINVNTGANAFDIPASFTYTDTLTSAASTTYEIYFRTSAVAATCTLNNNGTAVLQADEISQ